MNTETCYPLDTRKKVCRLLSPSKLNLGLRIVGRRPNGFHELESLFWPIDLTDEIVFSRAEKLSVEMHWNGDAPVVSDLPDEKDNLVWKILTEELPSDAEKWKVQIRKRIPIGGGLGGGSSNAGTVLRWLGKREKPERWGADIPFFLNPTPSWVSGIGEKITALLYEPALLDQMWFLILVPPFGCPTPEVFTSLRRNPTFSFSPREANPPSRLDQKWLEEDLPNLKNDLLETVAKNHPLIREILDRLSATGPMLASLSGSGSTCFGIYNSQNAREKAAQDLEPFCRKTHCQVLAATTHRVFN